MIEKTKILNEVYAFINERIHLIRSTFDNDEAFYEVLNGLKEDRKIAVEMIAFLHSADVSAQTIRHCLDSHDIVMAGGKLVYDGDMQYGYRKSAVYAMANLICEVYNNLSKEKMVEIVRMNFSHKACTRIEEIRDGRI